MTSSRLRDESETPALNYVSTLGRHEVWILPTRITDRFGNSVTYTYDPVGKSQLQTIVANDGTGTPRTISLTYVSPGSSTLMLVSSVTDGTRTWTYQYNGTNNKSELRSVTLPDNSTWQVEGLFPLMFGIQYGEGGGCDTPGQVVSAPVTGSLTHPSGARGEFVLTPVKHGRVGVPRNCLEYVEPTAFAPYQPKEFDTFALTKKTITGPGLPTMEWSTSYAPAVSGWAPWDGQNGTRKVEVRDPDGHVTRYTFGTVFMQSEGQLQLVEQIDATRGLLRSTATRYAEPIQPRGFSQQKRGNGEMAARVFETDRREITQQGTSFVWEVGSFNEFPQPTRITRSSSQGASRIEVTAYDNNLAKWVLGQVATVTEQTSGREMLRNEYDALTANLKSVTRFGLLEKSMTYHADGNIDSEKDGLNQETKYSNYRRGIPQNIAFADGATVSAVVNNLGGIDSVTNATGVTTTFGHDAMGRFSSIVYPKETSGSPIDWNATTISFEQVWSPEHDLIAGHWRQTITTGSGVEANYFDAFWRPVYSERWDNGDPATPRRIVKHGYDTEGRKTFESYPARTVADTWRGVKRNYDVLGRLVSTDADSELGVLHSTVSYDASAFKKTETNPRGHASTYAFQVFDQPSEEAITEIKAPNNVKVSITRDLFDKPTSITRSGDNASLTRSYEYDVHQRLVKSVEPETGATLQDYDAASNLTCRMVGLSVLAATSCDKSSMPETKKTRFAYDLRNRLKTTTYGDGSPPIGRTYTRDGLPETISSGDSVWTYEYNNRRLKTAEKLAYGGETYRIGYGYDANGSLSQLQYPRDNLVINYDPNALGEERRIGGFATGIQYHPNGAVAAFTYGNGIRRTLDQNERGLPKRSTDTGVLDESYIYDANANVEKIVDELQQTATRGMGYDALDRLWTVSAPNLWGTATYGYDAIDNMVSATISAGPNARTLTNDLDSTTNRLRATTGGPAAFSFSYGYDDQGNVTSRGTQTYRFDQGNRMTAAVGRATYAYDGLGHRFSTVGADGVNTLQIYTQEGKLLYSGPPAGGGTKYIYLNNHVIAEVK